MTAHLDRAAVREEMEAARRDFRALVAGAGRADLRRRTDGTRWTNRQLLFHMLFGYLLVRALLVLMGIFARFPDGVSRAFARLLDSARVPFHQVNYLASCVGALAVPPARMPGMMDRATRALERRQERETEATLRRGMHYPPGWDPFFTSYMTAAGLYHYPTLHLRFHQRQLTLPRQGGWEA